MHTRTIATHLLAVGIGIVLTAVMIRFFVAGLPEPEFHEHADIAVFIDGQRLDLSQVRYMTTKPCGLADAHRTGDIPLDEKVHLHDGNGNVIHVHYPGVTYAEFFTSIGMEFRDSYFRDADGKEYANSDTRLFRYFLNGSEVPDIATHQIHDLDRVLISYGRTVRELPSINAELAAVSDEACIASGSCPSRGALPVESCGVQRREPWILQFIGIGVK